MILPGYAWLKRQLNSVEDAETRAYTDSQRGMTNGQNISSSIVFIAIWLVALLPLFLWGLGRATLQRLRGRTP